MLLCSMFPCPSTSHPAVQQETLLAGNRDQQPGGDICFLMQGPNAALCRDKSEPGGHGNQRLTVSGAGQAVMTDRQTREMGGASSVTEQAQPSVIQREKLTAVIRKSSFFLSLHVYSDIS